eukprot:TRINITY_DN13073_c0_g3_i2.p1 TRINITY_DN13073_c0_g3~~TRINITY_DN13073_c0_g3_i2.p1  ORF type:complete len:273 (-),score=60.49 TRINITY_DN13073_c0_g3_i2:51-869(-)
MIVAKSQGRLPKCLALTPSFKEPFSQSAVTSRNSQDNPSLLRSQPLIAGSYKFAKNAEAKLHSHRMRSTLWPSVTELNKENEKIKKKLKEYQSLVNIRRNSELAMKTVSGEKIFTKLQRQALEINLLLARKRPTEIIYPLNECTANSSVQSQYTCKIKCKGQPSPLLIAITTKEGLNSCIHLSFNSDQLTNEKCDKTIKLSKPSVVAKFTEFGSTDNSFGQEWIYMGLETSSQCLIVFRCSFGKGMLECDWSSEDKEFELSLIHICRCRRAI